MCVKMNEQRRLASSETTNPVTGDILPFKMVVLVYYLGLPLASVTNDPAKSASWIAGKALHPAESSFCFLW